MREEATDKLWLAELAARLEGSGELAERAEEVTASHLARCSDAQAAALKAVLTVESAEITRMVAHHRGAGAMSAIIRLQQIVEGALRAFEASPNR
jgi:uncharacterized protein (DUF305 family)